MSLFDLLTTNKPSDDMSNDLLKSSQFVLCKGPVFGIKLDKLMLDQTKMLLSFPSNCSIIGFSQQIPIIIQNLIEALISDSATWTKSGLFRLASSCAKLDILTKQIDDEGQLVNIDFTKEERDTNGDLLKMFFRKLPEPLLTHQLCNEWDTIAHQIHSYDTLTAIQMIKITIEKLPKYNYCILRTLFAFCNLIHEVEYFTKMNARNLGVVLGPNLLWDNDKYPLLSINVLIEHIIVYYQQIFDMDPSFILTGESKNFYLSVQKQIEDIKRSPSESTKADSVQPNLDNLSKIKDQLLSLADSMDGGNLSDETQIVDHMEDSPEIQEKKYIGTYSAVYEYDCATSGLSLKIGDLIYLLEQDGTTNLSDGIDCSGEWWLGEHAETLKVGYFPSDYVVKVVDTDNLIDLKVEEEAFGELTVEVNQSSDGEVCEEDSRVEDSKDLDGWEVLETYESEQGDSTKFNRLLIEKLRGLLNEKERKIKELENMVEKLKTEKEKQLDKVAVYKKDDVFLNYVMEVTGTEKYKSLFRNEQINFMTLLHLTKSDLQHLGLPFGPSSALFNFLQSLQKK